MAGAALDETYARANIDGGQFAGPHYGIMNFIMKLIIRTLLHNAFITRYEDTDYEGVMKPL